MFVGIVNRVVVAGREDVVRNRGVDVLVLRDIVEVSDYCRRDDCSTEGEQVLEQVQNGEPDGYIHTGARS